MVVENDKCILPADKIDIVISIPSVGNVSVQNDQTSVTNPSLPSSST
jgi:hypothetical protein